jgi:hypothetical protein
VAAFAAVALRPVRPRQYIDNRSALLDLKILLRTAASVLKREGISSAESATMPEFTGSRSNRR